MQLENETLFCFQKIKQFTVFSDSEMVSGPTSTIDKK